MYPNPFKGVSKVETGGKAGLKRANTSMSLWLYVWAVKHDGNTSMGHGRKIVSVGQGRKESD